MLDDGEGLRERKRRQTRAHIAKTAMGLFAERGFDQVSVAEIAGAAGVADKTVYNYFPVKAQMFFDEAGDILEELLAAVRYRKPGASAADAVAEFIAGRAEWAAARRPARPSARFRQLIAASPALQAEQRRMFGRYETALARLLAAETGAPAGSAEPFTAAVALVGVIRAAFESGSPDAGTGGAAEAALTLLRNGLAGYARRPQTGSGD